MNPGTQPLEPTALLESSHDFVAFDCGSTALNDFLRKYAALNQRNDSARPYVVARGRRIVGYFTLAAGSVGYDETTARMRKGLARHPVPVILLARLAVDRTEQGQGLGKALVKDAMRKTMQAAGIIGCRAVLVHAKDKAAKRFYQGFGFEPSPVDEFRLFLLMKDFRASIGTVK